MSLEVAVLGTGAMGLPMARNMLRAGLAVSAWNRSAERAEPLAAGGATIAATPAEAVQRADVVVTMLTDVNATATVAREALSAMRDDAVWAQMGTVGMDGTELCSSLAEERGVAFVDAPVSGTKEPAEQGNLIVLPSARPARSSAASRSSTPSARRPSAWATPARKGPDDDRARVPAELRAAARRKGRGPGDRGGVPPRPRPAAHPHGRGTDAPRRGARPRRRGRAATFVVSEPQAPGD
jgi:NAD binding domain of 6-phosphogluconate dehydrogenase